MDGFLATCDSTNAVAFHVDLKEEDTPLRRLVAVAEDSHDAAVGVLDIAELRAGRPDVPVSRPGTVRLDDGLREEFGESPELSFEPLGGAFRGRLLWRHAADGELEGVPAGPHRVRLPDGSLVEVEVPADGVVVLSR